MQKTILFVIACLCGISTHALSIDRKTVVTRHNPTLTSLDTLASLTVGNGGFAMTVDGTGLQTFPEYYAKGVPLGTMSDWGWHSFPNQQGFSPEEALADHDFHRGHQQELYAMQFRQPGRQQDASNYFRQNPHRLHLGCLGFCLERPDEVSDIRQTLDLWRGVIDSHFTYQGKGYDVSTLCAPDEDKVVSRIKSEKGTTLRLRIPYPTGGHSDDACDWSTDRPVTITLDRQGKNETLLQVQIDETSYYIRLSWTGKASLRQVGNAEWRLSTKEKDITVACQFSPSSIETNSLLDYATALRSATDHWQEYWERGGIIDFSKVSDARAHELERRVILSQYLMAVNDAGDTPPQETGLTYNSWFGKFHLEMIWWHQAQFALWGHPELLDRSLSWYISAAPKAKEIASRQGFKGLRWMKMTDPSAVEAPSNVGSFLIWQQPHLIYLAELLYRACPEKQEKTLRKYGELVDQTATFMVDFAEYDSLRQQYVLRGCIPAQETLKADSTINPPFELSYWYTTLNMAQQWRQRRGLSREPLWDDVIQQLSPLAYNGDSLYLAAESATDTYTDRRYTSDHPALLGALGILPANPLSDGKVMNNTLNWIWENWNWDETWGWDYPMVAMTCARLGQPSRAVDALLMDKRTNTYLKNGHNYQDQRLRIYLPGNGGLLTAVAMMVAGWDGAKTSCPGFPADWDILYEGLLPMP